jgi:hypothetical protein
MADDPNSKSKQSAKVVVAFDEDEKSIKEFEKQLNKYFQEVETLTPYSINGIALDVEFSIAVRIEMMPIAFGMLGKQDEWSEEEIPFILRSQKDGDHIHDLMSLQAQELKTLS